MYKKLLHDIFMVKKIIYKKNSELNKSFIQLIVCGGICDIIMGFALTTSNLYVTATCTHTHTHTHKHTHTSSAFIHREAGAQKD